MDFEWCKSRFLISKNKKTPNRNPSKHLFLHVHVQERNFHPKFFNHTQNSHQTSLSNLQKKRSSTTFKKIVKDVKKKETKRFPTLDCKMIWKRSSSVRTPPNCSSSNFLYFDYYYLHQKYPHYVSNSLFFLKVIERHCEPKPPQFP